MASFLTWNEWVLKRVNEHEDRKPDYSFDRWLQKAKEFGDDVNKMVGHASEEEAGLDRKIKDKEAKPDDQEDQDGQGNETEKDDSIEKKQDSQEDGAWKSLRQIHKDRLKDFADKRSDKPSEKSVSTSGTSTKRSSKQSA